MNEKQMWPVAFEYKDKSLILKWFYLISKKCALKKMAGLAEVPKSIEHVAVPQRVITGWGSRSWLLCPKGLSTLQGLYWPLHNGDNSFSVSLILRVFSVLLTCWF